MTQTINSSLRLPDYAVHHPAGTANGTTVFLLHGAFGAKEYWRSQVQAMIHAGYRVVSWDAPGYGLSVLPPSLTIDHCAQVLALLLAKDGLRVALAGQDHLQLDTRELDRSEPSYTVDTLRQMRKEFGAEQSLILLLGADAFAGLPTWHEWRALFDLAHIAVMTRPGHDARLPVELATEIAPRRARAASDLRTTPCGKVLDLPVTPLEISASAVRALLAAGRDPRWLVPDALLADPAMLDTYRRRADRSPSGK